MADPNELKPNVAPDPNALPPLQQSNSTGELGVGREREFVQFARKEELVDISSSKKKKKKGLGKLNPF